MEKQFIVFRLQAESYSEGLAKIASYDTELEAIAFLERISKKEKDQYYYPNRYLILTEYTI